MTRITTVEARDQFSEMINRVAFGKERIVLTRRRKDIAVVIPLEDLALLEKIEDMLDVEAATAAEAEAEAKGEKPVLWDETKKKLGL